MKKLVTLVFLSLAMGSISSGILAYTHKITNYTAEPVDVKLNLKWAFDKNVTVAPGTQTPGGGIQPSKTVSINVGGRCIRAVEAKSSTGYATKEVEGWCVVPGLTGRSKSYEIGIFYDYTIDKGQKIPSDLKIVVR